ncbi:MAG TPA: helix-turn-helix transcriptional regulator [Actinomycetes bacterium]|nr:helix-turn-helix transcriptional regulator [Actinomycetes bacterium]
MCICAAAPCQHFTHRSIDSITSYSITIYHRDAERNPGAAAGTLYLAPHRLERAGLIASSWSMVGGCRRHTYRLTPAGRRTLRAERIAWRDTHQARWRAGSPHTRCADRRCVGKGLSALSRDDK